MVELYPLSKAEFDHIHSDDETGIDSTESKIPWVKLLGYRQTWAFSIGKFMTDPIWWFFLFWYINWCKFSRFKWINHI